ncbi:MAG: hypothetical protein ABIS21_03795 [Acidimicrobiales bacterium]
MRFRMGLMIGFGTGYYLGTMAGRERYEQINHWIDKVKRTETFEVATDTARTAFDVGVEKAKDLVESSASNGDDSDGLENPYLRQTPEF